MASTLTHDYFSPALAATKESELREAGYGAYLDSVFLQRLKGVSFLGVLDFVYELEQPSSRYVHTVCAAHLALALAQRLMLSVDNQRAFVIANLLHDVGHAAFSHNSEPFLLERLNLYHQGLLSAFYVRSNRLARDGVSLADLVAKEGATVAQNIASLILQSRTAAAPLQTLFHSPLNCDKLEGNHRTLCHLGRESISPEAMLALFEVRNGDVFMRISGADLVVDFWSKERDLYWTDIYTSAVFAAEAMLTRSLELFFEGPSDAEAFLFMTDAEAFAAVEANPAAADLIRAVRANNLFVSLSDTRPEIVEQFEEPLRDHRFDRAIRREIEGEIASAIGTTRNRVISHFSRRKHFAANFDELWQMDLFDRFPDLMPLERVVNAVRNSKRPGDFFDVFWWEG